MRLIFPQLSLIIEIVATSIKVIKCIYKKLLMLFCMWSFKYEEVVFYLSLFLGLLCVSMEQ